MKEKSVNKWLIFVAALWYGMAMWDWFNGNPKLATVDLFMSAFIAWLTWVDLNKND